MSTVRYLLVLVGQSIGYAWSSRRLTLVLLLLIAPLAVALAIAIGVSSPFLVYPFI
ncbi:MAG: hypothetical protein U0P45_07710 [Acidimicrobiales bacterium]